MAETVGGVSYSVDVDYGQLWGLNDALKKTGDTAKASLGGVDGAVKKTETSLGGLSKSSAAVSNAFRLQKGSAQQLGFQLQDVAVQAQMGTSWFTILGQQGSQLASVFGAGGALFGAVIAISAAIGGVLVKAMTDAGSAAEKLPAELQARLDAIKQSLQDVDEESKRAFSQVELGKVNAEYNKLSDRIQKIIKENEELRVVSREANSPSAAQRAGIAIDANNKRIKDLKAEQADLAKLQEKITNEVILSKDGWTQYKEEAEKSVDVTQQIAQQVQIATDRILNGEDSARRLALAFQLGLTNAEQIPAELQKALSVLEEAEARAREESEFRQQAAADQREALRDIESERKAAHQQELERIRAEDAERKKLESVAGGTLGLTRLQQLAQQYEQEKTLLIAAQNAKIESEIAYQDRLLQLEASYAEARAAEIKRIQEGQTSNTQSALEMAGFSYEQLSNQAIGTFASIASGAQSGTDAIRSLAQSILTQAIGALIKMSIQSAILKTAETASGVAQASTLTTAYAPAAAAASVATGGAAAVSGASLALGAIGLITGALIGGGRLYGGAVSPGKMYPITENGKPEILQQGAKQYLLPGSGGNVISNKDMQQVSGGGMSVQINVQNNTPSNVDVQRRQGPNKTEIIDIVVADIQSRGKTLRAITSTTTASNKL